MSGDSTSTFFMLLVCKYNDIEQNIASSLKELGLEIKK